MLIKFPKDDQYFSWTRHIKNKMIYYGLSEQRIRRVLKSPKRKERGIAPNTLAVMQRNDRGKKKEEIWVMYQERNHNKMTMTTKSKKLLISAWRYQGVSKPGAEIPIPEEILNEVNELLSDQVSMN